ncbi:S-layer homology domain-containing protein [Paenibacillus athensensis]|nr:S-layer homology domain-containing protein [Paenibacillus athensensis]MCD1258661.1 S-layer homology domain-containing protein [Paenibacillus athensensis]
MINQKTIFCLLLAGLLSISVVSPAVAADRPSTSKELDYADIRQHWASPQLQKWVEQGRISGYADGALHPDQAVSRAELIAMINRVFGFTEGESDLFADVHASDWFAGDVAKASKAGYVSGYPGRTFRPLQAVTREEASVMLQKAFRLPALSDVQTMPFGDEAAIQSYAKSAVRTLAEAGYLTGYADGTFKPKQLLSRAEAVVMLDRIAPRIFTVPGVYAGEQIEGNAVINASGITLTEANIAGNLYVAEGIGSGDAWIKHSVIGGVARIHGGGSHSIHIEGSRVNKAILSSADHSIRLVLDGTISELEIQSQAVVEISAQTHIGLLSVAASAGGTTVSGEGTIASLQTNADMKVNGTSVKQGSSTRLTGGKVGANAPAAGDQEPAQPQSGGGAGSSQPVGGGSTQPGSGSGPTEPGSGTGPTEPGSGTGPTEPGSGTGPTEPGSGTGPTEPGSGTGPTEPGSGTGPTEPGSGTGPTEPGSGTGPTEPGSGTGPTEPGSGTEPPVSSDPNWTLVWNDEFNGNTIDASKWNFVEGGGGFGNNELQYYTQRPENARVENGSLVLQALQESYKGSAYTSAKLMTKGKGDWTYGRYEIRAKLPNGKGMWPAIWMMPSASQFGGWPASGEIDIMELLGHEPNKVYGTIHYGNPYNHTGGNYTLENGSFSDDYHTFSVEWAPGQIQWFVDGILYSTKNDWYSRSANQTTDNPYPAPFDRDFYLQLNLAVGGNWPGNPDATTDWTVPKQMLVDYVRVYAYNGQYPEAGPRPGKNLAGDWTWIRENAANWFVDGNPKQLNVTTQDGSFTNTQTALPGNILVKNPGTDDFSFSVKVKFNASVNFEYAGLIAYQDDKNYVSLGRCFSSVNQIRFTKGQAGSASDKNYADSIFPQDIYLKIEKSGNTYTGYYSQDGITWTPTADSFTLPLTNPQIGLFTRKLGPAAKTAVFSEFTLNGQDLMF